MAEAVRWGKRGARLNAISPGIVMTPLAKTRYQGREGKATGGCREIRSGTGGHTR
jgi:NAD(P)-dependent dehydrogenase (short-subunit alcohol dehydrogenase family)